MSYEMHQRALEILRNHIGPSIMTMLEAVKQAKREAAEEAKNARDRSPKR